jgi:hypothetical protein
METPGWRHKPVQLVPHSELSQFQLALAPDIVFSIFGLGISTPIASIAAMFILPQNNTPSTLIGIVCVQIINITKYKKKLKLKSVVHKNWILTSYISCLCRPRRSLLQLDNEKT